MSEKATPTPINKPGSGQFKMAATKPEVLVALLLDVIETKFQRLAHIFGVGHSNGTNGVSVWRCLLLESVNYNSWTTGDNQQTILPHISEM